MKVVFYNHTGRISGAERVLLLALEHLDREKFEATAICPDGELAQQISALEVPVQTISELNARFTLDPRRLYSYARSVLSTARELRRQIVDARGDAIHANSIRAGIAALFASAGTRLPVYWHIHDELKSHPISTAIRLLVLLNKRCRLLAVSQATAGSFTGNLLKAAQATRPVRVIHNAIDPDRMTGTQTDLRKDLSLSEDSFLFGLVGQITPRKGQLELIRTFAKVSRQMPAAKLLIVGKPIFNNDDEYLTKVVDAVHSLGLRDRVLMLGHRSDAANVISQLDTLIINSRSEAFVMVAIEAMAAGTPVIATNVGGTNEMIQHRYNGWLVEFGNETQLTEAMLTLYENDLQRRLFVRRSKTIVEQRLNVKRFIAEFQSALLAEPLSVEAPTSEPSVSMSV